MIAILWLCAWFFVGSVAIKWAGFVFTKFEHWLASLTVGLTVGGMISLAASHITGFTASTLIVTTVLALIAAGAGKWLQKKRTTHPSQSKPTKHERFTLLWLAALMAAFLIVFGLTSLTTQDGGLWINNRHDYGDIRLHLSYINTFVSGQNIPVENPIFSGEKPSYPFIVNFITSILVILGLPLTFAYNLLMTLGYGLILGWVICFGRRLTGSLNTATLAAYLFLASGGVAFYTLFLPEWIGNGGSLTQLWNVVGDYAIIQDRGYWLGNSLTAFFNTQRTFILGFPLTLLILLELWKIDRDTKLKTWATVGILIGALTIIHTSSIVIIALSLPFFALHTWKNLHKQAKPWIVGWLTLGLPVIVLGGWLLTMYVDQTHSLTRLSRLELGWMSSDTDGFILFWIKNAGVLIVSSIAGYIIATKYTPNTARFYASSWIIFLFANILVTQPWNYDNSKYLLYWVLFASCASAQCIGWLWKQGNGGKLLGLVLVAGLTASGAFDLLHRLNPKTNWFPIVSASELAEAKEIQAVIPPKSNVLTYGYMLNPFVAHLGRPMVYGDEAWLWSHGLDFETRKTAAQSIYAGTEDAYKFIRSLQVDYIIISNNERQRAPYINELFFDQFTRAYENTQGTVVYKIDVSS